MRILQVLLIVFTVAVVLSSCTKDNKDDRGSYTQISGISCTDINGQIFITLGTPSDYIASGGTDFILYPNPCVNSVKFSVKTPQGQSIHYYIIPVEYKYPPGITSTSNPNGGIEEIKVENLDLNANTRLIDENTVATTANPFIDINTANYKSGFYRLYVTWNGDQKFIDFLVMHS